MNAYTDPDVFLSKINQLRDKLGYLDEVISADSLPTVIFDALPAEKCLAIKLVATRDPNLNLEQIIRKCSGTKKSQDFKKYQEVNRRDQENGQESEIFPAVICFSSQKVAK